MDSGKAEKEKSLHSFKDHRWSVRTMRCPFCGSNLRYVKEPILSRHVNGPENYHCLKCCNLVGDNDNQCRFKFVEPEGVLLQVTTGKRFHIKTRKIGSKHIIGGRLITQS